MKRPTKVGDFSAWVSLAMDEKGVFYVDAELAKEPAPAIVSRGVRLTLRDRPERVGVEKLLFEELLAAEWDRQARAAGLAVPTATISHDGAGKQIRIRRLGQYLGGRRIRFNAESWGGREVVNQLRDFPVGDHDDGPDALEMAIRLLGQVFNDHRVPAASRMNLETR